MTAPVTPAAAVRNLGAALKRMGCTWRHDRPRWWSDEVLPPRTLPLWELRALLYEGVSVERALRARIAEEMEK